MDLCGLKRTREICWFVFTILEKSAGLYLQYSRNLLVCIYNTREICWFIFTLLEKSAGLYLHYTRILLVGIYNTREISLHYLLSVGCSVSLWL